MSTNRDDDDSLLTDSPRALAFVIIVGLVGLAAIFGTVLTVASWFVKF